MVEQEKMRIEQLVHNKVLELSNVDSKIDMYMDISMDEMQPEWKRTRASTKLLELEKQVTAIKKCIRENDPKHSVLNENNDDCDD